MSRYPTQAPHAGTGRARRFVLWVSLLVVTCVILLMLALVLVVRMPVSLLTRNLDLPPSVVALHGSIMAGQAVLDGGYALRWDGALGVFPLPHLRTDLALEGADTRLTGELRTGFGGIALDGLAGRAGPGLAVLAPGAWDCGMSATARNVSLFWGWRRAGAGGVVTTPEGVCTKGVREATLPRLRLDLSSAGADALARLSSDGTGQIALVRLARERLFDISIDPAAADIFPVLPRGGPIRLELPF